MTAETDKSATLGSRIRVARHAKDWTSQQLADAARLSKGFLSDLENDKTGPSVSTVTQLSDVLGVSVEWLVRGREVKPMKCPMCKGKGSI